MGEKFPADDDMLFLRVDLCAWCIFPMDSECECGRDLGREPARLDECRCWLAGRATMGSWGRQGVLARVNCIEGVGIARATGRSGAYLEDSHVGEIIVLALFEVARKKRQSGSSQPKKSAQPRIGNLRPRGAREQVEVTVTSRQVDRGDGGREGRWSLVERG